MHGNIFSKFLMVSSVLLFSSWGQTVTMGSEVVAVGHAKLALAAAMITALDSGNVCAADAYPASINDIVASSTSQLDPAIVQAWALTLPSTSKIHSDFAFRQAVKAVHLNGPGVSKTDVERQLTGTKFFRFGMGVYGSPKTVVLSKNGVAEVRDLEALEAAPYTKWVDSVTPWEVVIEPASHFGEEATLKIDGINYQFENNSDGEILLVPMNVPAGDVQRLTFSTSDSYCEA